MMLAAATSVAARAQAVITVIGTGTASGISFRAVTPIPMLSSSTGLTTIPGSSILSCTVPAGETCDATSSILYDLASGLILLQASSNHAWAFPPFRHNGEFPYNPSSGTSLPGILFVGGVDATAGAPQANATGATFQFPLEVTATDGSLNYQKGLQVTFTAPGAGASATLPGGGVVTTDANGRASITPTANATAGAYQITARATIGGQSLAYTYWMANVNTANASGACVVTTANDDFSAGSLRNQVATCGKGGTITFQSGINPNINNQDILLTQDLTIDGGAGGTTLECSTTTRLFYMTGGTITLKNLTIDQCDANGGLGGNGALGGGGGAGMGGAIFQADGTLNINNVTFSNDFATGGNGGGASSAYGLGWGGGGGMASNGGSGVSTPSGGGATAVLGSGNGGGGGIFGGSGGSSSASAVGGNGSGVGAGGGAGDPGGASSTGTASFGGGGGAGGVGATSGSGGFGGGAGGTTGTKGSAGTFGGAASQSGGGGAGLGGAIFVNAGTLSLINASFTLDAAQEGLAGGAGAGNGQAKGGALYIASGATATYTGAAPVYTNNFAQDAGSGTPCSFETGAGSADTSDVCGILLSTNANHFVISTPGTAIAGTAISFTVTATNVQGNTDPNYTGTVHFTSTDTAAVLPGDYTFQPGDAGVHTFTAGATFHTAGSKTITATDTVTTSITGTSPAVTVSPGPVHTITVTSPTPEVPTIAFNINVTLKDQFGNSISSSSDTFTFSSTDATASLPPDGPLTAGAISVILQTKGTQTITVTDTTLSISGTSNSITVTALTPTIAAAFAPVTIPSGSNSTLTITVTNPNTNVPLTNVSFSNAVPSGVALITESGGTCDTLATSGGSTNLDTTAGTISVSANTLDASASCNVTLSVTSSTVGAHLDTTSTVTANEALTAGTAASATLTVISPPSISMSFVPSTIAAGGATTLSFTITNPNSGNSLTGVAFTDTLPSGMTVATPNGLTASCGGGTITATAGTGTVSLSGATLAASGNCTFSVNVTVSSAATYSDTTGAVTSSNGGTGNTASATLTALAPPSISKSFGTSTIPAGGSTSLSFTVANPNSGNSLTGVGVTDTLPSGMTVATPNGLTGSCGGGTITATAGSAGIQLAGATLLAASNCTFSVNVTSATAGAYTNTTSAVASTNGGIGNTASASLTVLAPPSITKAFGAPGIGVNASTSLSFTIHNPNGANSLTGVAFTDTLPSGMTVATPNGLSGSCGGGSITATAGSGSVQLAGATLATSESCTFSVNVTAGADGTYNNTTGAVSSNEGGSGNVASASLMVGTAPSISKSFGASSIAAGASTSLNFTITNPNSSESVTGIAFTDTFPSGLTIATPNGLTGSCGGGTITATAGAATVSLSNATIGASASCTFSVNVTASAVGTYNNVTGAISSSNAGTGNTASATLVVGSAPSIAKSFGAASIPAGGTTSLSFTITNPNASTALSGITFTDTFPSGLTIATPNGLTGSCGGGTITAAAGSASVSLSGATLAVSASCTFSINATATAIGTYTNVTGAVTSTNAGTGNTASASLIVAAPPSIAKSFGAAGIPAGGLTSLSFTIANPNSSTSLTGVAFTDAFPSGLTIAAPNGLSGSCGGGTITAVAGSSTVSLSGATLAKSAACTFAVNVTSSSLGPIANTTQAVTSNEGGTGGKASATLTVTVGTATHFSVSAPSSATAGTAFNFTVTALDQFNNPATSYTGIVHFSSTDASGALPANSTLTNGAGSFSVMLKTAGTQTLTATDTASSGITGTSNPISVSLASGIHFNVTAPSTATAGTPFTFTVTAADPFNNTVTNYAGTVSFSISDSKAILPASSTLTNGTGTFSATLKTAGVRTLTAADTTNFAIAGAATITVAPGPPASITINSGTPQTANLGGNFTAPLSVTLVDAFGNPTPGVTVAFTAPSSGASCTFFGGSTGTSNLLSASMAARPDWSGLRPETASNIGTAITNTLGVASISATANGAAGTYTVTAAAGTTAVPFYLTNSIGAPTAVNPGLTPGFATLQYTQGGNAATATVNINSDQPTTYSATVSVPWLTVSPATGSTNRSVTITGNGTGMAQGIYSSTVVFTFGDGSSLTLPVQIYVFAAPLFKPDTLALTFNALVGTTAMQQQSFFIRSAGADFAGTLALQDVAGNGGVWAMVTPASYNTPALIQVQVNPTGLAVGVYQKNIVFVGAASNSPVAVSVTFNITPLLPTIAVTSVVNGASFAPGALAPNTIATAFGTFPGCTSKAQATIDGTATSVFYSSPTQISLLVPASVAGEATAQLQIQCSGMTSAPFGVSIVSVDPALFTVTQNGTGQADVVNPDNSIDTPSPAGTVIQLYGTGFGVYNTPGTDGLTHLAQTVTATVGGTPAQVLYAGQAPGNTAGLQQIDILIPTAAASSTTPALQLTVGEVTTQASLTLAIR